MSLPGHLSAALLELPARERASLAVDLIDSLGEETWEDERLAARDVNGIPAWYEREAGALLADPRRGLPRR